MIKLIVKHTIFKNFNKKCFGMAWWLVGVRYRLLFFVIFAIALYFQMLDIEKILSL